MQQRYNYIDIAKGIGILLVIALHSRFHIDWMVSFEMPLFFILSGCFFKYELPFKQFLKKKVNMLLIPYVFFELPKVLYDIALSYNHRISIMDSYINSSVPTTTWFLLCLFEIQVICYFIYQIKSLNKWIIVLMSYSIGYLMYKLNVPNILFICSAVTSTSYFTLGLLTRNIITGSTKTSTPPHSNIALSISLLFLSFGLWYISKPYVFYRGNSLEGNFMQIILMAIFGSYGIIYLAKSINSCRILEYYGRYSLIILGVHLYYLTFTSRCGCNIPPMLQFIITCILMLPAIYLLKKFVPRLCGIKPLIQ